MGSARRLLSEESSGSNCANDYVTLKEPFIAEPYLMGRNADSKGYKPQLERGSARCPMVCKAEASGSAYEQHERILARFNHLTGEATVSASNLQVEHGSSLTISVTCESVDSQSEQAVLSYSYNVEMQDECVAAKIKTPAAWETNASAYLWNPNQVATLSTESFSA